MRNRSTPSSIPASSNTASLANRGESRRCASAMASEGRLSRRTPPCGPSTASSATNVPSRTSVTSMWSTRASRLSMSAASRSCVRGRGGDSPLKASAMATASRPPMKIGSTRCGASCSRSKTSGARLPASTLSPRTSTGFTQSPYPWLMDRRCDRTQNTGPRGVKEPGGPERELCLLDLDLDVDARRQLDALQRVDGLGARLENVEQALVDAHLEVLAAVLVLVWRADHREAVLLGGQRDRPPDRRLGAQHGLDDLLRRLVDDLVVVRLQADANLLLLSHLTLACQVTNRPKGGQCTLPPRAGIGLPTVLSALTRH